MSEATPYTIPKQLVWEAYQRMKANRGAAGVVGRRLPIRLDLKLVAPLVRIGFPSVLGRGAFFVVDCLQIAQRSRTFAVKRHSTEAGARRLEQIYTGLLRG